MYEWPSSSGKAKAKHGEGAWNHRLETLGFAVTIHVPQAVEYLPSRGLHVKAELEASVRH